MLAGNEGSRPRRRNSIVLWKKTKNTITQFEPILAHLERAAASAHENASLVHVAEEWFANQAAIFSKAPEDSDATATLLGKGFTNHAVPWKHRWNSSIVHLLFVKNLFHCTQHIMLGTIISPCLLYIDV